MASLQERKRKNGSAYLIQFSLHGERKSLFLDVKYNREMAEEIKVIVERCVDAIETDSQLDRRTLAWLENTTDDLRERFIACGLVEPDAEASSMTIGELYEMFLEDAVHKRKATTLRNYESAQKVVFRLIDETTRIAEFQKRDALDFASRLAATQYAEASRYSFITAIKSVFSWGVERELIEKNPFSGVSGGGRVNKRREYYVDFDLFAKMLAGCRNAQERALLTFYRIAGMRRLEGLLITWRDVDFENGRLCVHSPKTERIAGKEKRIIPLFPQLRAAILDVKDEKAARLVSDDKIVEIKGSGVWIMVRRMLKRENLPIYPRLIQNLRSSASIDIYRKFGELAENAWLGHSVATAKEHYLHVLDADFQKAVEG